MLLSLNPGLLGIKATLAQGAALARRHGFDALDVSVEQLHEAVQRDGAEAVRELFARYKVVPGLWNLPFRPYTVTTAKWRDGLARLSAQAASASAVGATRVLMWILPGSYDREYRANFAFHVERFHPVAQILADHGIRLGLEFIGPVTMQRMFKHPFVRSVGELRELTREIGPNCGQVLDSFHWYCAGGLLADLAGLSSEELVGLHLNDAPPGIPPEAQLAGVRRLPGATGVIDLAAFLAPLAAAGFTGPVTAQPNDSALNALPPEEAVAQTARALQATVAKLAVPV